MKLRYAPWERGRPGRTYPYRERDEQPLEPRIRVSYAAGTAALPGMRPGLTLIEVLVAMAIMLLALVAIGRLVDIGTNSANEARLTARGTRLAESKMAEVEAGAIALDAGGGATPFDEEPSWSWNIAAQPSGPANLYQVTVHITRDVNGRKFEVTLSQMILDPKAMGTSSQASKPAAPATDTGTTTTTGTGGTMP